MAYAKRVISEGCLGEAVARVHDLIVPANHGLLAGGRHALGVARTGKVLTDTRGVGVDESTATHDASIGPELRGRKRQGGQLEGASLGKRAVKEGTIAYPLRLSERSACKANAA